MTFIEEMIGTCQIRLVVYYGQSIVLKKIYGTIFTMQGSKLFNNATKHAILNNCDKTDSSTTKIHR